MKSNWFGTVKTASGVGNKQIMSTNNYTRLSLLHIGPFRHSSETFSTCRKDSETSYYVTKRILQEKKHQKKTNKQTIFKVALIYTLKITCIVITAAKLSLCF